jgi:hypothetical protein
MKVTELSEQIDRACDDDSIDNEHFTALEVENGVRPARQGRWTRSEHIRFIQALTLYGRDWRRVQLYVKTRTST